MANSPRYRRAVPLGISALASTTLMLIAAGCGTSMTSSSSSTAPGTTRAQSQPASGPSIGYVWDAGSQSLRPVQGVAGASIVGPATITASGAGYISSASSEVSGTALFLNANGVVFQSLLAGGMPAKIATVPGATGLVMSNSGNYALVTGKAASGGPIAAVISGLPAAPSVLSLNLASVSQILGGSASDAGIVALATGSGQGVSVLAFAGQAAGAQVATAQAFGGVQFVPGSDELVVADGANGAITAISHVNTTPSSAVLSPAGGIAAPVALDITSNAHWVVAANHSGDVLRVDLTGVAPAAKSHCSCAPSQVVAMSGNTVHLVTSGGGPLWIVDAGSAAPRVLFIPAPSTPTTTTASAATKAVL